MSADPNAPTENEEGAGKAPFDPTNLVDGATPDAPGTASGASTPIGGEATESATAWSGKKDD